MSHEKADRARSLTADADHLLAAEIAEQAGELLLNLRESGIDDADVLRSEGDRRSHDLLSALLGQRRPGDAILSEEGAANPARLDAARVWIIDPLDGTREFGEEGRTDWAVHVALAIHGVVVVGAVALPALGEVWSTAMPRPPHVAARTSRPRLAVSRTRPGAATAAIAEMIDHELVPMGSAGAKTIAVVRGDADIYAHSGGQYEWDSAAPVAVAVACGLHASRLDGSPLLYNNADPYLPDLLVARPLWVGPVLQAIAAFS